MCMSEIQQLRELFIKRMTVDSETQDRRRSDFNQAIFEYYSFFDDEEDDECHTAPIFEDMSMDILQSLSVNWKI